MELKFSVVLLPLVSAGAERFNPGGYREPRDPTSIFPELAKIEGLRGLEVNYPFVVNRENAERMRRAAEDYGLSYAVVGVAITQEARWARGALASLSEETRRQAVARVKEAIDVARAVGSKIINVWPGREGFDYPFSTDYRRQWDAYVDSLAEVAEYAEPDVKIAIEPKVEDPQGYLIHGSAGRALATVLELRQRGIKNVGVMIEFSHSRLAREYNPETVVMLARHGALYHLQLNDMLYDLDLDLPPATYSVVEYAELLYWLHELGYDGWLGLDLYPRYVDPVSMVRESVANLRAIYSALERVGWDRIRKVVQGGSFEEAQGLVREVLWGARG